MSYVLKSRLERSGGRYWEIWSMVDLSLASAREIFSFVLFALKKGERGMGKRRGLTPYELRIGCVA